MFGTLNCNICSDILDLKNVFEVFLPQLLLYPNPTDPLNATAASMLMRTPDVFKKTVKEYVAKYARDTAMAEAAVETDGVKDSGSARKRAAEEPSHAHSDDDDPDGDGDGDGEVDTSHIPDL